jgi:hypothetical protein
LLADILKKSVLFVVFLIALTVIEEIIVGYFHGRILSETEEARCRRPSP